MAMSPYVVEDNGGEVGRVPAIKKDREMLDLGHVLIQQFVFVCGRGRRRKL